MEARKLMSSMRIGTMAAFLLCSINTGTTSTTTLAEPPPAPAAGTPNMACFNNEQCREPCTAAYPGAYGLCEPASSTYQCWCKYEIPSLSNMGCGDDDDDCCSEICAAMSREGNGTCVPEPLYRFRPSSSSNNCKCVYECQDHQLAVSISAARDHAVASVVLLFFLILVWPVVFVSSFYYLFYARS